MSSPLHRRVCTTIFLLTAALFSFGCHTNPATGKLSFNTMSESAEIELGEEAEPQFIEANGGLIPSDEIQRYVEELGQRLAAVSERPELPWEFHVINSAQVNAFALPGGKVFMSRGLLARMNNEAQLAGVLGHEIGHVTAQHVGQRMSRANALQILGIGIGIAGVTSDEDWLKVLGVGTTVGGTVYLLQFSRGNESESDMLGVRYMTRLGYNPYGQVQVMEILKAASEGGNAGLLDAFLSTHPLPEARIEDLKELIAEEYPLADQAGRFEFNEERFEQAVLRPLKTLPAPTHPGQPVADQ